MWSEKHDLSMCQMWQWWLAIKLSLLNVRLTKFHTFIKQSCLLPSVLLVLHQVKIGFYLLFGSPTRDKFAWNARKDILAINKHFSHSNLPDEHCTFESMVSSHAKFVTYVLCMWDDMITLFAHRWNQQLHDCTIITQQTVVYLPKQYSTQQKQWKHSRRSFKV